jgi:antitoxin component HigA of HigAB toxin-antitoxin module
MKPTATQIADELYRCFRRPEDVHEEDPDQAVFTLPDVLRILKLCNIETPDFKAWGATLTDKSIKSNKVKRLRISSKIKSAMKAKGITNTQLAELCGKRKETITRALSGANLTLDTIIIFEKTLGVNLLDID